LIRNILWEQKPAFNPVTSEGEQKSASNPVTSEGEQKSASNSVTSDVCLQDGELKALELVKILAKGNDFNINYSVNGNDLATPLIQAATVNRLEIMRYCISQGANIFLARNYANGMRQTVVGVAYENYIKAKHSFLENHPSRIHTKRCLDFLIKTVIDDLSLRASYIKGDDVQKEKYLYQYINDLAGNFSNSNYEELNSAHLKELLNQEAWLPVQRQIKGKCKPIEKIPVAFISAASLMPMRQPYLGSNGQSYEEEDFKILKNVDKIGKNFALQNLIEAYNKKKPYNEKDLQCPVTLTILCDPFTNDLGQTYEYLTIVQLFPLAS
jgi:hypothetical protein